MYDLIAMFCQVCLQACDRVIQATRPTIIYFRWVVAAALTLANQRIPRFLYLCFL